MGGRWRWPKAYDMVNAAGPASSLLIAKRKSVQWFAEAEVEQTLPSISDIL